MAPSFTFNAAHAESARWATRSKPIDTRSSEEIDREYKLIGCIGRSGTFGHKLLLTKKNPKNSNRKFALKLMIIDTDDDATTKSLEEEIGRVVKMSNSFDGPPLDHYERGMHFEDYFIGPGFACIVTPFSDFGALADEIDRKKKVEPYAERRIAYYMLQISDALAHAHYHGVVHRDVCSSNVHIDNAGRLRLGNFCSVLKAEGQLNRYSKRLYAPPEFLEPHQGSNNVHLAEEKVDSFGLGCIVIELLSCCRLKDLSNGQTISEFIARSGVEAAMRLPCLIKGYSHLLRRLVMHLVEPDPKQRWLASEISLLLSHDHNRSPLLSPSLHAAQRLVPGAAVTVDNVQLGMFVQRGRDWKHGGMPDGRIGVVVKLDAGGGFTEAVFPSAYAFPETLIERFRYSIGAGNMFELQVGPPLGHDTLHLARLGLSQWYGIVWTRWNYVVGSQLFDNLVIVAKEEDKIFVCPTDTVNVPTLAPPKINTSVRKNIQITAQSVPMKSITAYLAGYAAAAAECKAKGDMEEAIKGGIAKESSASSQEKSKTKECVVCMERPVRRIILPCGHPCLCDECSKDPVLRRLRCKCPECRQRIGQTAVIYGRVVDD